MTFLDNPGFLELYYEEGLTKYYIAAVWGQVTTKTPPYLEMCIAGRLNKNPLYTKEFLSAFCNYLLFDVTFQSTSSSRMSQPA